MTKVHGKRYVYKFNFDGLLLACQQQAAGPADPTNSLMPGYLPVYHHPLHHHHHHLNHTSPASTNIASQSQLFLAGSSQFASSANSGSTTNSTRHPQYPVDSLRHVPSATSSAAMTSTSNSMAESSLTPSSSSLAHLTSSLVPITSSAANSSTSSSTNPTYSYSSSVVRPSPTTLLPAVTLHSPTRFYWASTSAAPPPPPHQFDTRSPPSNFNSNI